MAKRMGAGMKAFIWILAVVGAFVLIGALIGFTGQTQIGGDSGDDGFSNANCPSDLTWSGTVDMQNIINTSGTQTYDSTVYFYNAGTDTLKTSITDTTSGAVTLTCGQTYDVKILSTGTTTGTGDGGYIRSFSASGSTVNADGSATFTATGDGEVLTIGVHEWGTTEIRVFDNSQNAWSQTPAGDGSGNWSFIDGLNLTGADVTGFDVDSGGEVDLTYYLRAYNASLNYNDGYGILVLVDADTTNYEEPAVKIDGSTASNIKDQLTASEKLSYADYEYVYLIDAGNDITLNDRLTMDFFIQAISGIDPGTSSGTQVVQVDFSPRGTFATTANSNILAVGAVDDSSSRTQVHNLHDTFINVIDDP